ncbi:S1/P1 Nuclease [Fulvivirga sp. RKSG066]|nr:S1/P1 nuclease [Fulvivirga aurantia]MTI22985.1 S1/P1 Nuclease [Fulvivirga aurantia]
MSKKYTLLLVVLFSVTFFNWGIIGHRSVGHVAQEYLNKKAAKALDKLLDGESLAEASTWMDEIRSDSTYDYAQDWHWVTIPTGKTYEETDKNPNGDVIATIQRLTSEIKAGGMTKTQEVEAVKMLIHLVGDIHQPLHVGTGEDRGGNSVKIKWFWQNSNLHRVWDSEMIESQKYSYTELANILDEPSKDQVKAWQSASVIDWANESIALRDRVYDIPEDENLKYEYQYKHWEVVELRLQQAGIRLAGLLNELYG